MHQLSHVAAHAVQRAGRDAAGVHDLQPVGSSHTQREHMRMADEMKSRRDAPSCGLQPNSNSQPGQQQVLKYGPCLHCEHKGVVVVRLVRLAVDHLVQRCSVRGARGKSGEVRTGGAAHANSSIPAQLASAAEMHCFSISTVPPSTHLTWRAFAPGARAARHGGSRRRPAPAQGRPAWRLERNRAPAPGRDATTVASI